MQLPRHIFQQITGTDGVRTGGRPREKRSAGRVPVSGRVSLLPLADESVGKPVFARLRDLSLSGVGVLTHSRMAEGEQFILAVPGRHGKPILIRCRTARCRQVEAGLFMVGAAFTEMLGVHAAPPAEAAAPAVAA